MTTRSYIYHRSTGNSSSTGSLKGASYSKIDSYIQILEKMSVSSMVKTLNSEDLQQVRYAATRILQHVCTLGWFLVYIVIYCIISEFIMLV